MEPVERIRGSPSLRTWLVSGDYTTRVAENTKLMNEWRHSLFGEGKKAAVSMDTEEGSEWMLVPADGKS